MRIYDKYLPSSHWGRLSQVSTSVESPTHWSLPKYGGTLHARDLEKWCDLTYMEPGSRSLIGQTPGTLLTRLGALGPLCPSLPDCCLWYYKIRNNCWKRTFDNRLLMIASFFLLESLWTLLCIYHFPSLRPSCWLEMWHAKSNHLPLSFPLPIPSPSPFPSPLGEHHWKKEPPIWALPK